MLPEIYLQGINIKFKERLSFAETRGRPRLIPQILDDIIVLKHTVKTLGWLPWQGILKGSFHWQVTEIKLGDERRNEYLPLMVHFSSRTPMLHF